MRVLQAYRFALDPSPAIERACRAHVGAKRFAFNWGLALVQDRLGARRRGEPVTVPYTLPALRREWNQHKTVVAPWWPEHSKEAYSSGLDALARALKNHRESRQGKRKGRRLGFPAFRKKGQGRQSVRFTTGAIRVEDRTHIVLPRMGIMRTHEPTTALLDRVQDGRARILSATLSSEGGRWYVSFTCDVEREERGPASPDAVVGVDTGLRDLAVLSTGERIPAPRPLRAAERHVARANRELARRKPGSGHWNRTKQKLTQIHARCSHIRRDALHKLTRRLATTYGTFVVETLNVAGMMRGRLAKSVADTGMAEIRRQLEYKHTWYGSTLIKAPQHYPSSKRCAQCGVVKTTLPWWVRVFHCEACGTVIDRDDNAAQNLAALVAAVAGSGPETQHARGRDVRPRTLGQTRMKREAGSEPLHQTGTPMPQGVGA
jgi:putative transposase